MSSQINENENNELVWINIRQESEKMKSDVRFKDKLKMKAFENPFVPIGLVATFSCLCYGIFNLVKGDSVMQQKMMRGRVLAQGLTVVAIVIGIVGNLKTKVDQIKIANPNPNPNPNP